MPESNNVLVAVPLEKLVQLFGKYLLPKDGETYSSAAGAIVDDLKELVIHDDIDKTLALQSQQVIWNPGDDPLVLLMAALRELSIAQELRHKAAMEDLRFAMMIGNGE